MQTDTFFGPPNPKVLIYPFRTSESRPGDKLPTIGQFDSLLPKIGTAVLIVAITRYVRHAKKETKTINACVSTIEPRGIHLPPVLLVVVASLLPVRTAVFDIFCVLALGCARAAAGLSYSLPGIYYGGP